MMLMCLVYISRSLSSPLLILDSASICQSVQPQQAQNLIGDDHSMPLEYIAAAASDSPIITYRSRNAKNGIKNPNAGPGSQNTRNTKFPASENISKMEAASKNAP